MIEDDDATAARECLAGNGQAFTRLVERYERPVYNVALRMLRNPEDARDVSQTVFLKAYQGLEKYDPQYKFYSWIYRSRWPRTPSSARSQMPSNTSNRTTAP
jgi:RNA polymerase sigma-70 factor (ECF subfamily)